jgi:cell division protein FtsL
VPVVIIYSERHETFLRHCVKDKEMSSCKRIIIIIIIIIVVVVIIIIIIMRARVTGTALLVT